MRNVKKMFEEMEVGGIEIENKGNLKNGIKMRKKLID